MRAHGPMIKPMEEGFIDIKMEQCTMAIGRRTFNMDLESRSGQMAQFIKVSTSKARSMGMAFTSGMMVQCTRESGTPT